MPNDDKELQELSSRVAYVLCYDKQRTFEDGEIWDNPNYEEWLETYKEKSVAIENCRITI